VKKIVVESVQIRAKTWQNLDKIIDFAERIVDIVREKTGRDYRSSYADSLLFSAFIVIWLNYDNFDIESITKLITDFYKVQQIESHRDESEEIISRLMDEQIDIIYENKREKLTIHECLHRLITKEKPGDTCIATLELKSYEMHLSRFGLRLQDDNSIAIQNNHHMIKRIIGHGTGYAKILKRHKGCEDHNKTVYYYDGQSKKSTVIGGIIKRNEDEGVLGFD